MVLLVTGSSGITPTYTLTEVEWDNLTVYAEEDDTNYVWRKEFRTTKGLARAIDNYFTKGRAGANVRKRA